MFVHKQGLFLILILLPLGNLAGCKRPVHEKEKTRVTVEQLVKDYKADENAAYEKYKDKTLEAKGFVLTKKTAIPGDFSVILGGTKEMPIFFNTAFSVVYCDFVPREAKNLALLTEGQDVTIRGLLVSDPKDGIILLESCEVIESGPDTAIHLQAEDLAKEFASNTDNAMIKYHRISIAIQGAIREKDIDQDTRESYLVLEGQDKRGAIRFRVVAILGPSFIDMQSWNELKKGQKCEVLGRLKRFNEGRIEVEVEALIPNQQ